MSDAFHLCIDMEDGRGRRGYTPEGWREACRRIRSLHCALKRRGIGTAFLLYNRRDIQESDGFGFRVGQFDLNAMIRTGHELASFQDIASLDANEGYKGSALSSMLDPGRGDRLFIKSSRSALELPALRRHIESVKPRRLVISGMADTDCVAKTTAHALHLGYDVDLLVDRIFPVALFLGKPRELRMRMVDETIQDHAVGLAGEGRLVGCGALRRIAAGELSRFSKGAGAVRQ